MLAVLRYAQARGSNACTVVRLAAVHVELWVEKQAIHVLLMLLRTTLREARCRRNWPVSDRMLGLAEAEQEAMAGCSGSAKTSRASRAVDGER